jgi:hypothetical protein
VKVALLNRDDMGDGLKRADLRSGEDMIVLFKRLKRIEMAALAFGEKAVLESISSKEGS